VLCGTSPAGKERKNVKRRFPDTRSALPALRVAALVILLVLSGCSRNTGTVEGKITAGGIGAPAAEVQFFVRAGEERSGQPFAVGTAGGDGSFRMELPAGTYYVVARRTAREGGRERTYKGEYSGNPVPVAAGGKVEGIDVPLAEMSSGGFVPQEKTGVTGAVTSAGRPVPDAYVYAYPEEAGTVRGPAYVAFARTDGSGRFRIPLREGAYRIVARRKGGENETGAMKAEGETGGGSSVTLAAGATKDVGTIALHAAKEETRRLRVAAGGQETARAEIRGMVERDDGSPGAGVYVMAYADHRMIGRPFAISGKTGEDGSFVVYLPKPGKFYVGARSEYGGPLSPGEWVGTYDGTPDHSLEIGEGETKKGIRIRVVEKW
jgi:hypothetical protein